MNVGEWLAMQAMTIIGISNGKVEYKTVSVAYKRPHDNMDMIEIRPNVYLNRQAYEAGYDQPRARAATGETVQNTPIGNSITPWRVWAKNELNGRQSWEPKRSWR